MIHQIKTYLQWLPKTFYLHGIQSPFVYTLTKECLKNHTATSHIVAMQNYRSKLLSNDNTIVVTDFGAGSRVFKSNTRKISNIAQHAGATQKRMQLLQRLVKYLKPENILELGTSLGMATFAMAKGNPETKVTSLEGCPATLEIARETLNHFNIHNVELLEGRFRESIKNLNKNKIDLIYYDGNHSREATIANVNLLLPTAINGSVWIFDDIHWSPQMTLAWEYIKNLPQINVTIDCYDLGIAFFRNEQVKEDFYVKI